MSERNKLVRPRALTPEVQKGIIEALARGNYITTACQASGISFEGFRHWRARWESGDPLAMEFDDFFASIEKAISVGEMTALDRLGHGAPGWQAQAWFLERRFPQRWGKKDRTPVPPKAPKPLSEMTPEELDEHERKLGKG
jgi:transposase